MSAHKRSKTAVDEEEEDEDSSYTDVSDEIEYEEEWEVSEEEDYKSTLVCDFERVYMTPVEEIECLDIFYELEMYKIEFSECTNVRSLHLSTCEKMDLYMDGILSLPKLEEVYITLSQSSDPNYQILPQFANHLNRLKRIVIERSRIGAHFQEFAKALQSPNCALEELILTSLYRGYRNFSIDTAETNLQVFNDLHPLMNALCLNQSLFHLNLRSAISPLENHSSHVSDVCRVIRENHTLRYFKIHDMGFGTFEMTQIASAMEKNSSIVSFGLIPHPNSIQLLLNRNIEIQKIARESAWTLILCRTRKLEPNLLNWIPMDVVKMIARYLFSCRRHWLK